MVKSRSLPIGTQRGYLVTLSECQRIPDKLTSAGRPVYGYLVKCLNCKCTRWVDSPNFKSGRIRSCGCLTSLLKAGRGRPEGVTGADVARENWEAEEEFIRKWTRGQGGAGDGTDSGAVGDS